MKNKKEFKEKFWNKDLIFTTNYMAKQADGSIFVSHGNTQFLVTVVTKELENEVDFLPLIINFEEKLYSTGKIPGNYLRREAKPTDTATLKARIIDRALRPLILKNDNIEIQIVITVLSYDPDYEADMYAILAASFGLQMANVPVKDIVAGLTVAKVKDQWIVNPNLEERLTAKYELKVAGTDTFINMIEFVGEETQEAEVLEVLNFAHDELKKLIQFQKAILNSLNIKIRQEEEKVTLNIEILEQINLNYKEEFYNILKNNQNKKERNQQITELKQKIQKQYEEEDISKEFEELYQTLFIEITANESYRLDGRNPKEIRTLNSEVDILKMTHGSALFTRGETQSLSTVTLGIKKDEQILDGLEDEENKQFFLHYNFPPYSVGEIGRMGAPGRREIGHGFLAEKALKTILPTYDEFPYTIRVNSEILESNGSSSQATICAGTLALMDAGVPIKKPVSGIAMGLIKQGENYTILSDIAGLEDHLGDMDFKVAGTRDGITAIQMDIKIEGITKDILRDCLYQAKEGRAHILNHMLTTIPLPNNTLKATAPKIIKLEIDKDQIKDVIGRGGEVINKIIEQTEVKIDIEEIDDKGKIIIYGIDLQMMEKAENLIEKITKKYKLKETYQAKVIRIEKYGAFVKFLNFEQEALLHISNISEKRIEKVEDVLKINDEIEVEIIEIEGKNRLKVKLNEKK